MASLESLVQALLVELFNKIFDLTFTTDSEWSLSPEYDSRSINRIPRTYKPPSTLEVNRASRAAFARSYYGIGTDRSRGTAFYISQTDAAAWISSLTPQHVDMLYEVRIRDLLVSAQLPVEGHLTRLCFLQEACNFEGIAKVVSACRSRDLRHVISVQVYYAQVGGPFWTKLDQLVSNGFW